MTHRCFARPAHLHGSLQPLAGYFNPVEQLDGRRFDRTPIVGSDA